MSEKNENWLLGIIQFPVASSASISIEPVNKVGGPKKNFEDLYVISKRRNTKLFRENYDVEELCQATQMKLRLNGNSSGSKILKDIADSPEIAAKYAQAYKNSLEEKNGRLAVEKALSVFADAGNYLSDY